MNFADTLLVCAACFLAGWFIGSFMTWKDRSTQKSGRCGEVIGVGMMTTEDELSEDVKYWKARADAATAEIAVLLSARETEETK